MDYLADTNVLLRSVSPAHPAHGAAVHAVATLLTRGERVCVFPQNLIEFRNVATRPANLNGLCMTVAQTDAEVSRLESLLALLPDDPAIYAE